VGGIKRKKLRKPSRKPSRPAQTEEEGKTIIPQAFDYGQLKTATKLLLRANAEEEELASKQIISSQSSPEIREDRVLLLAEMHMQSLLLSQNNDPDQLLAEDLSTQHHKNQDTQGIQAKQINVAVHQVERLHDEITDSLTHVKAFIPIEFTFRKVMHQWVTTKLKSALVFWLEFCEIHKQEIARLASHEPYCIPIQRRIRSYEQRKHARQRRQDERLRQDTAVTTIQALVRGCIGRADAQCQAAEMQLQLQVCHSVSS
jgi:hypothetical protein